MTTTSKITVTWNNGSMRQDATTGEAAWLAANGAWNAGARDVVIMRGDEYLLRPGERPAMADMDRW